MGKLRVILGTSILLLVSVQVGAVVLTYNLDSQDELYDYDTETGVSTFRTSLDIGNNDRFLSMDIRPSDSVVFAPTSVDFNNNRLYTLDQQTGASTLVGTPGNDHIYTDIAFNRTSNELYGITVDKNEDRHLVIIDQTDASFTIVGELPYTGTGSSALGFDDAGNLYSLFRPSTSTTSTFYGIDLSDASGTVIGISNVMNTPEDFAFVSDSFFVTDFSGGLYQLDISTGVISLFDGLTPPPHTGGIFLNADPPSAVPVAIDIKPGSDPNSVNPKSKKKIPVAVLGSIDFDATQIDFSTVTFGPDGATPAHDGHVKDVNRDGFPDMVFHFKTQETGIACGDTEATLNGETFGEPPFQFQFTGTDAVKTVGCK